MRVDGSSWDGERNSRYIGAKRNRATGTWNNNNNNNNNNNKRAQKSQGMKDSERRCGQGSQTQQIILSI